MCQWKQYFWTSTINVGEDFLNKDICYFCSYGVIVLPLSKLVRFQLDLNVFYVSSSMCIVVYCGNQTLKYVSSHTHTVFTQFLSRFTLNLWCSMTKARSKYSLLKKKQLKKGLYFHYDIFVTHKFKWSDCIFVLFVFVYIIISRCRYGEQWAFRSDKLYMCSTVCILQTSSLALRQLSFLN